MAQAPQKGMYYIATNQQYSYREQKPLKERHQKADSETAQERLAQIGNHLGGSPDSGSGSKKGKSSLLEKHADDVSS